MKIIWKYRISFSTNSITRWKNEAIKHVHFNISHFNNTTSEIVFTSFENDELFSIPRFITRSFFYPPRTLRAFDRYDVLKFSLSFQLLFIRNDSIPNTVTATLCSRISQTIAQTRKISINPFTNFDTSICQSESPAKIGIVRDKSHVANDYLFRRDLSRLWSFRRLILFVNSFVVGMWFWCEA